MKEKKNVVYFEFVANFFSAGWFQEKKKIFVVFARFLIVNIR